MISGQILIALILTKKTKNLGQRSNGSNRRAQTNIQTDKHTNKRTLPSALSPCFTVDKYITLYFHEAKFSRFYCIPPRTLLSQTVSYVSLIN